MNQFLARETESLRHGVNHVEHRQIDGEQNHRDRGGQADSQDRLECSDEYVGLALDLALEVATDVARGAFELARLLADNHQLADDRREHVAMPLQLATEAFATANR